ncbi:hypothetical protein HH219_21505 [Pseudoalteromonas sp. NEC-BIFX-2020_015]|uniref:hypothetical protein n=1 Tax=Pseudoalteromonas sp. NEC-BIFX-2020_015 TaxID=2729544 RepID=UPI0014616C17|nr:hypothetical protein [Pseudoalteromonas sp. NEC-BIFX-2020_015]NMR28062.1 hypothetical protein [Pseudoalteromonas sp. NEC-BIFX-2020_015]
MISENFSWSESIYLKYDSIEYDLHNDFDFIEINYIIETQSVTLKWKRGTGNWVNQNQPDLIVLNISNVSQFEFKPRDSEMPFTEDDCLESFGFISDDDWCDGQFWADKIPDESWLWSFIFQSGAEIIIGAKSAIVQIEP